MAEETSQTDNWDFVLEELQRIDSLDTKYAIVYGKVADVQNQVQLLKKVQGVQNLQQQANKQQQVIKSELSPTLTQKQRKRYQNIGKEFVKGAALQFQSIKKAIKMKQNMDTKKKDFMKSTQDMQDKVKKQVKGASGGFWKKLLGIVAVLGVVAYLFRDKIAKLIPDLSETMKGLSGKVAEFFGNLIGSVMSNTSAKVTGGFAAVIKYACSNVLPNLMGTFFHHTLPTAMVMSTLAVMSMFSESAGQQLAGLLNQDIGEMAETSTEIDDALAAQRQLQFSIGDYTQDTIKDIENRKAEFEAGAMQKYFGTALLNQDGSDLTQNLLRTLHGETDTNDEVDNRLMEVVSKDNKLLSFLAQQFNQVIHSNKTQAQKRKRIREILMSRLGQDVNIDQSNIVLKNIETFTNAIVKDSRYQRLQQITELKQNINVDVPPTTVPKEQQKTVVPTITNINVGEVLGAKFGDNVISVLSSLNEFVNGKVVNETLKDGISSYFKVLTQKTQEFFDKNYEIINSTLKTMGGLESPANQSQNESQNESLVSSQGVTINVSVQDVFSTSIGASLSEMKTNSTSYIKTITESNKHLETINKKINDYMIVYKGGNESNKTMSVEMPNYDNDIKSLSNRVSNVQAKLQAKQKQQVKAAPKPNAIG